MNQAFMEHFLALAAIPHPSRHEEAISRHLYQWALSRGLEARQDAAGNVAVDCPATPGLEDKPLCLLQAHMDMVAVGRPGSGFDPLRDGVEVINDGTTLRAARSSLGADDCAGVALIQTLLEEDFPHGPLRAVFTTDEESGMSGASALDPRELGGKYLLNLDWENGGSLCCSSAGNEHYRFTLSPRWEEAQGEAYLLEVSGLLGGHSGTMIHTGRANALRAAAGTLRRAWSSGLSPRLASLTGGTASNAIPASAQAVAVVPEGQGAALARLAESCQERALRRFGDVERDMRFRLTPTRLPDLTLTAAGTMEALDLLCGIHIGVNSLSPDYPGLVESSANLGSASISPEGAWCEVLQRSSSPEVTAAMRRQYALAAARNRAVLEICSAFPPWPPRPDSPLTRLCQCIYRDLTGEEISVEPVHAGLECGIWTEKNPALDIISIGPEVRDIHSPEETLELSSVELLHDLVTGLLREIGQE